MAVPKLQGVIEPGPKNGRGLTRVLSCTEYDYRLGRLRLVTSAPDEYRRGGDDPERKCRHHYKSQYSAKDIYDLLCLLLCPGGSTLHQVEATLERMSGVRLWTLH